MNCGTIYRTPYHPNLSNRILLKYGDSKFRFIRKFISGYFEFAQFIIPVGPKVELYHFAKKYLLENKVDAIIATGDPFILFSYASKLSEEFNTPWIADYRDTWVQDKTRSGNKFTKRWNAFFEKKFLKNASLITTVSSFIVKQLKQNLPVNKYEILINGFNPDVMNTAKMIKQGENILTIGFAGTIYKWHPIKSVLSVFNQLLSNGDISEININFYGLNFPEEIKKMIENDFPKLISSVFIFPKMENDLLVMELAKANVFLLFNDYSILGTKIFTYLGLKRKILLCYSNDKSAKKLKDKHYNLTEFNSESKELQANLIRETKSGIVVEDDNQLKIEIIKLQKEFDAKGYISCDSEGIEKYSRKKQAEKLAEFIAH